jgi:hypothetical protein
VTTPSASVGRADADHAARVPGLAAPDLPRRLGAGALPELTGRGPPTGRFADVIPRTQDIVRSEFTEHGFALAGCPLRYGYRVIALEPHAAAYAEWITPDLPLYGSDHDRGDLAP